MNLVLMVFFAAAVSICAQEATLTGSQIRGHGKDGRLICAGINLPSGGTITSVTTGGDGFWIEGPIGVVNFQPATNAVNYTLPAGTYKAFPNLKPKQDKADVSIKIRATGTTIPPSSGTGSSLGTPAGTSVPPSSGTGVSTGSPAGKSNTGNPSGKNVIVTPAGHGVTGNPPGKVIIDKPSTGGSVINISGPKGSTPYSGGAVNQAQPNSGQKAPPSQIAPPSSSGGATIKFGGQNTIKINP